MKKYVIHAPKLGYYQPAKDNTFKAENFVDTIEDAYWYATENTAIKASIRMSKYCIEIHVIDISVTLLTDPCTLAQERIDHNKHLVRKLEAMTDDKVEALSEAEWQSYKKAKRYLREFA